MIEYGDVCRHAHLVSADISEAHALGRDPAAYLANNDAYAFFERVGGLLKPGPTHTNVMDVMMALVAPA